MKRSTLPQVRALARALINAKGAADPTDPQLQAVEAVLRDLSARISPLMGGAGFQMLLERALTRAQEGHPQLARVEAVRDGDRYLVESAEAAVDAPVAENGAAAEAIISELIGLLARFVGADMAIGLVRQAFPELSLGSAGVRMEENEDE